MRIQVREDIGSQYNLNNFTHTINLYNINLLFSPLKEVFRVDRYNDNINFVFKQRFNKSFLDVAVDPPADTYKLNNLTYGFKDYEVFNGGETYGHFFMDFDSGRKFKAGKINEEAEKLLTARHPRGHTC